MKSLRIEFVEHKAEDLVELKRYDNEGNVIGMRPEEEIEAELKECEGKIVIDAIAMVPADKSSVMDELGKTIQKQQTVRSSRWPEQDKRHAILQALRMIAESYAANYDKL